VVANADRTFLITARSSNCFNSGLRRGTIYLHVVLDEGRSVLLSL